MQQPSVGLKQSIQLDTTRTAESQDEEERRSQLYHSLVRAQRRYADKVSNPTGPHGRFSTEEWDWLGTNLSVEDLEGGFLTEEDLQDKHRSSRKENIRPWKGKEVMVDGESDEEDAVHLRVVF